MLVVDDDGREAFAKGQQSQMGQQITHPRLVAPLVIGRYQRDPWVEPEAQIGGTDTPGTLGTTQRHERLIEPQVVLQRGGRLFGAHPAHVHVPHAHAWIDALGIVQLKRQHRPQQEAEKDHTEKEQEYTKLHQKRRIGNRNLITASFLRRHDRAPGRTGPTGDAGQAGGRASSTCRPPRASLWSPAGPVPAPPRR